MDNPSPRPKLGGCLVVAFLTFFVVVCGLVLSTWAYVGTQLVEGGGVKWVVDADPYHPGFARAMPTVNGIGDASQQLSLDVSKPYTFPYGCVESNTTSGGFGPLCP